MCSPHGNNLRGLVTMVDRLRLLITMIGKSYVLLIIMVKMLVGLYKNINIPISVLQDSVELFECIHDSKNQKYNGIR